MPNSAKAKHKHFIYFFFFPSIFVYAEHNLMRHYLTYYDNNLGDDDDDNDDGGGGGGNDDDDDDLSLPPSWLGNESLIEVSNVHEIFHISLKYNSINRPNSHKNTNTISIVYTGSWQNYEKISVIQKTVGLYIGNSLKRY